MGHYRIYPYLQSLELSRICIYLLTDFGIQGGLQLKTLDQYNLDARKQKLDPVSSGGDETPHPTADWVPIFSVNMQRIGFG